MLRAPEEHSRVFYEQPLVVFGRALNLNDSLVRAKTPKTQTEVVRGSFLCGKSSCQVYSYMSDDSSKRCSESSSSREYEISRNYLRFFGSNNNF